MYGRREGGGFHRLDLDEAVIPRLERWAALALLMLAFFVGAMLGMVLDARLPRRCLENEKKGK